MAKKTKNQPRRRRMRGGGDWWNPLSWGKPSVAAAAPPAVVADTLAKPVVDSVATPTEQADTLGVAPGAPSSPAGSMPAGGRRRRRTRKHRRH